MDYYRATDIRGLTEKYGLRFTKAKGQNFLIDVNIVEKIVRLSGVDGESGVLEVGPGTGALTVELAKKAGRVVAVEVDAKLMPVLRETLRDEQNVEIICDDILKLDIVKTINEKMPDMACHACSNLPYSITTPAIVALVGADVFKTITVMVQSEVAGRICAAPGTPEYGSLTLFVNYYAVPEILFDAPPECFIPRPEVRSSVIRMDMRRERLLETLDEDLFFRIVRAAFGQRRKTLVNALCAGFGGVPGKEAIAGIVTACGFDARIRGEALSVDEFAKLTREFRRREGQDT